MSTLEEMVVELEAALGVVTPQIDGMNNINNDPVSNDLHTTLGGEIVNRQRRQALLTDAIRALSALSDDGYPALDPVVISGSLKEELDADVAESQAGAGAFVAESPATMLQVNLGEFTDKE